MTDTLSVYFQVHSNRRAVFECLRSFRRYYPDERMTLLSDAGDDFTEMAEQFGATFTYSDWNILPHGRMCGLDGVYEYLRRIYEHCLHDESRWVLLMEEDVQTLRRVNTFPVTECAGTRLNPYSPELTKLLESMFGPKPYGYGMCGGSIFRREAFLQAYELFPDFGFYVPLDDRIAGWGDIPLTLLFHLAGFDYGVWGEVSERLHPVDPIVRDAAFDHAFKYFYGFPFDGVPLKR